MSISPALRRLRQERHFEFEGSTGEFWANSVEKDPVSNEQKQTSKIITAMITIK